MNKFNLGDVVYTIRIEGRGVSVKKGTITKMMLRGAKKHIVYYIDGTDYYENNVFSSRKEVTTFLREVADSIDDTKE